MSAPVVPPSSAPPEWLPALLEQLVADEPGDHPTPTLLIRFEVGDDISLGTKALEVGQHPSEALLGFVAPDEWFAFGVIAAGWASRTAYDDGDAVRNVARGRPSKAADRVRVLNAHVVSRDGYEAGALRLAGEPAHVRGLCRATDADAPTGSVPDLVRRVMGVDTAPAGFPPTEILAAAWLTEVADASGRGRRRLQWDDAVGLAPQYVEAAELAAAHPEELDWSALRWSAIHGAAMFGVDPTLAAWFDDGSFARWAIANYLPVRDLMAAVAKKVTNPGYRSIVDALRSWGVAW